MAGHSLFEILAFFRNVYRPVIHDLIFTASGKQKVVDTRPKGGHDEPVAGQRPTQLFSGG